MIIYNFISFAGNLVPAVKTAVSDAEMIEAIKSSWRELHKADKAAFPNPEVTEEQIALILAKNAGETGRDRSKMFNYNIGNITIGNSNGPYWEGRDWKYVKDPKDPKKRIKQEYMNHFRSYDNLHAGVKDYLYMMSKSDKYKQAWKDLVIADPSRFSKDLKKGHYYDEDESVYTKRLISLFKSFKQKIKNPNTIITLKEVIIRAAPPKKKQNKPYKKKIDSRVAELERINTQLTPADLENQDTSPNIKRIEDIVHSMSVEAKLADIGIIKLCEMYYNLAINKK